MCNRLFCYSGRCTGTRATQCTQQSPSLRVKQNTLRNKISPGTRFSCRARSIVLYSTPVETYVSYALNRILDTAIGVIIALLVNYFLPRERVVRLWEGFKKRLGLCR